MLTMILYKKLLLDRATGQLASWLALFTNHKIAFFVALIQSFKHSYSAILSYQIVMQGFFTANTKYVRLTLAKNVLEHHHN
jgi:hypothetical protein